MYAILGDYRFDGYKGFKELEVTDKSNYAKHALIDGKPRLQNVGEELREISLNFLLHSSFTNPERDKEFLNGYRRRGEIISFITGDGSNFGNFVITDMVSSYVQTDNKGNIISVELEIQLLEVYTPDAGKKKSSSEKIAVKLPEVQVLALPARLTDPQIISANLRKINTNANAMDKELTSAQKVAQESKRAIRQAKKRIAKINASIAVIEKVGLTTLAIINYSDNIKGQVSIVKNSTAALSAFVEAGDLNSAVGASGQLRTSTSRLNVESAPINNLVGVRRDKEPVDGSNDTFDMVLDGKFV